MHKKIFLVFFFVFTSVFVWFICAEADIDSDLLYFQSQLQNNQAQIQKTQKDYIERKKALEKSLEYKKQSLKKEYLHNLKRLKEERARLMGQEKEAQSFIDIRQRKRMQQKKDR